MSLYPAKHSRQEFGRPISQSEHGWLQATEQDPFNKRYPLLHCLHTEADSQSLQPVGQPTHSLLSFM